MNQKKYIGIVFAIPILICIWYILFLIVNSKIVPNPFIVFKSIPFMLQGDFYLHCTNSLNRIFIGILISVVLGGFIGTCMGLFPQVDKVLNPIVYLTYPVPKLAVQPIIILTFGLKESSKISMIVLIIIFQIITAIRSSVLNIPKSNFNYFEILGVGKIKTFFHVTFPVILKNLFISLKIAVGTAISVLFFTETYGTKYGLGYYIMDSFLLANYVEMYGGIVILSSIGFTIFIIIDILEDKLTPWNNI